MAPTSEVKLKIFLYSMMYLHFKNKNSRKYWIHPINLRRKQLGEYFTIVKLVERHPEKYFKYFRMSKQHFDYILSKISNEIKPSRVATRRDTISAKEKLVITLRFLATGCSFTDLSLRFLMGRSTVEKCIYQTILAINKCLLRIALPHPKPSDWTRIASDFYNRWNFPNCLGAIDGKHIDTFAPNNSGSLHFNYKKRFSTVLMAVVDANYKFISVDIGAYGANADSTIFTNSQFGKMSLNDPAKLGIPDDAPLPRSDTSMPFVLVGDEAFSLKPTLLTPYPGQNLIQVRRIFNYRLSRARRIVEKAFGVLSNKWRILLKRIEVKHHQTMNNIVMSCVILHNVVKSEIDDLILAENDVQPSLPTSAADNSRSTVPVSRGYDVREAFANWCINEGDRYRSNTT